MTNEKLYEAAKELYASLGVDTDAAMEKVAKTPVGIQCWQGDDVTGLRIRTVSFPAVSSPQVTIPERRGTSTSCVRILKRQPK